MVIGARPTGWNWVAGNTQGFGGVNAIVQECLTKTGSMYKVVEEDRDPLPNLAKNWEWSDDGTELTMNLIRGAHWSDGEPFDADDLMFLWEDNILDPNVPALATANTFGEGTTLEKVDENGTQLPYKNEVHIKLSEWTDRLVQTLADNADLANMDEPTALLDGVQRANAEDSSVRVILGPRTQGWAMEVNFSQTNGVTTEKEKAIRELNRDLRFRLACGRNRSDRL